LKTVDNWNEVVFLTTFLSGDTLLIVSFLVARQHWRPDLPQFSRETRALDVFLHPAKYVLPKALRMIRSLQVLGGLLMVAALLALARQAVQDFLHLSR